MIPNEVIFIVQILITLGAVLAASRLGEYALVSVMCLFVIIANMFVTQTILLFGATATSTDAFMVSLSLAVLLLQKQYGEVQARRAILISFIGLFLFTLLSIIHLWYVPAPTDIMHAAFVLLLTPVPRILIASALAYGSAQLVNIWLFRLLHKAMGNRWLMLQTYGAVTCSQILDTLLFTILGLYGVVAHLTSVAFVSMVIKMVTVLVSAPLFKLAQSLRFIFPKS